MNYFGPEVGAAPHPAKFPGTRMAGYGVLYYNQQANPARPAVLSRKKRG
jgi:hypothetical protein